MRLSFFTLAGLCLAPAAFGILDTDNDGLSDFWERQFYNGSRLDESFDPQGDDDGDGWTNAQEAEAGTNPFDPNPPDGMISPIMASVPPVWSEPDEYDEIYLISPEAVTVTWPTIAGKQYTLFFSPDLTQGSWLPVGNPFIAYGGEATYGFEISQSDRCFWRVTATDVDSDYDGLSNYEEISAGTNPYLADSDSDTLSDWQEFMAGSSPLDQDTDGDGTPDPLDADPLVNALAFADADGDGIPDTNDANPNDPRGPAPSVASENASGNPLSNLIKDETVKFVLSVSNPAGPAPTASNLAFFLNGTEEDATITALGSPVASCQRFLLTWVAKTTANYPTLTIQNLALRFRDSVQATSWLSLARIDVAEWEGKIITLPYVYSDEYWTYDVFTHLNGVKKRTRFVSKNDGSDNVYRGPKTVTVVRPNGGTSEIQLASHAIPFLKISGSQGGAPNVVEQKEFTSIATGVNSHFIFINESSKSVKVAFNQGGIDTSLNPGESSLETVDLTNAASGFNSHVLMSYREGGDWNPFFNSNWPVGSISTNGRVLSAVNFVSIGQQLGFHSVISFMERDAKITPYASGSLEYPGLPQESVTSEYDRKYMPIGTEEWRKIVIRIYPPQQHFTYSKGYRLNIGTGTNGNDSPQAGLMLQTQSGGTLTPLTVPVDGKIEMLAPDSDLYQQITSPEGLVLFLKRDTTADQAHVLSVDILPIIETNLPVRLSTLTLLPVEIVPDFNRDGKIDQADSGKVTTEKPWRWWINDDNDLTTAERGNNLLDVPNRLIEGGLGFFIDCDCHDLLVDGMRDHIDFFPLHFDLKSALEVFPASEYKYVLKHEEEALKYYEYPSCVVDGSEEGYEPNRHVKDVGAGRGLAAKALKLASMQGSELSANMLANLKYEKGVVVIEGAKKTEKPLVLEISKKSDSSSIAEIKFPIRIVEVEDMFRQVNLREVMGGTGGNPTQTDEPPGYPDDLTNGKYVAYVHGFNISGESARGSQSNIFKRFHQLGSKARYIGISWYGNPPNSFNNLSPPDYHRAAYNGLTTAIVAKNRLSFTQNSELTILAHSLGNSLVGSAIACHGLKVDHYYIINGAIPLEAYDSAQTSNSSGDPDMERNMTEDDWKPFYDHGNNGSLHRLLAANWHELFTSDPTDDRNKLKWKDIFAKPELLNIAYNFYSPSDEVVENPDDTEEAGHLDNVIDATFGGGRHAWVSQELAKGGQNWAIAGYTFHDINAGWNFNPHWDMSTGGGLTFWRRRTPDEAAAGISDAALKAEPFHGKFLLTNLHDPTQGSATAGVTTNRYKLLGSGIPAMSYAIAANNVPKLDQVNGGEQRNFNMPQDLRSSGGYSSWPEHENSNSPEDWMHSDFKDVALQFLHPMYHKMIDLAELNKD